MKKKNLGFTLYEMIIVVVVMGIVTTMAFPDFVRFFDLQSRQSEEKDVEEIRNALELYSEDQGEFPSVTTWAEDLAPYSFLSEARIATNADGVSRVYVAISETTTYRAGDLSFGYAIVASAGPNGSIDEANDYDFSDADEFVAMNEEGDDIIAKATNRSSQVKGYEVAMERLNQISLALSNYASYRQNEVLAQASPPVGAANWIYYPPSGIPSGSIPNRLSTTPVNNFELYGGNTSAVVADVTKFIPATSYVDNGSDVATRRANMQALMRLLGLPESFCCNPLARDATGDEIPFFYYSNPRARTGPGTCDTRPTLSDPKLPPRVTVEEDECG